MVFGGKMPHCYLLFTRIIVVCVLISCNFNWRCCPVQLESPTELSFCLLPPYIDFDLLKDALAYNEDVDVHHHLQENALVQYVTQICFNATLVHYFSFYIQKNVLGCQRRRIC